MSTHDEIKKRLDELLEKHNFGVNTIEVQWLCTQLREALKMHDTNTINVRVMTKLYTEVAKERDELLKKLNQRSSK